MKYEELVKAIREDEEWERQIQANSSYNDGWTRDLYKKGLNRRKSKRHCDLDALD
jgi:hypothetical protein